MSRACLLAAVALASLAWTVLHSHGQIVGGTDESSYLQAASSFEQGTGLETIPECELTKRPPVYPFALAAATSVTGSARTAVLLVNSIAFLLIVLATYRLAVALVGETAGCVTAMIVATHPGLLNAVMRPLAELLFVAYLVIAAVFLVAAWRTRSWTDHAWLGVALALAALTKPVTAYLPLYLLFAGTSFAVITKDAPAGRARGFVLSLLVFYAALFPWAARNRRALGAWVPVSTYGPMGIALSIPSVGSAGASDDVPTGLTDFPLGDLWEKTNRLPERGATVLWKETVSRYFQADAGRLVTYAAVIPRRWFWVFYLGSGGAPRWGDSWGHAFLVSPDVLIVLAPLGLLVAARRRRPEPILVGMIVLYFLLVHSFAIALPRYRLPFLPLLFCLVAYAVVEGGKALRLRLRPGAPQ